MENWKQIYAEIKLKTNPPLCLSEDIWGQVEDAKWLMHLRLAYGLDPCLWNELRLGIFEDLLKVFGLRKKRS